jgi:hypothetical protein
MSSLQDRLGAAIARARNEALLSELLANEALTIGDLSGLRGELGEAVRGLTIGELRRGTLAEGVRKTRGKSRAGSPASGGDVETRTPAGRRAYEGKLLATLEAADKPTTAQQLRKAVGGTPDQARRALNRLIDAGKVKYTGRARGTRYALK